MRITIGNNPGATILIAMFSWVMIAALAASNPASAASIDMDTRIELQTELRDYISGKTRAGVYTYFDDVKGETRTLSLKKIHNFMFIKDERYMLCADFMDNEGSHVVMDYIFAPHADGYRLEKEVEGRRAVLVTIFEKIL